MSLFAPREVQMQPALLPRLPAGVRTAGGDRCFRDQGSSLGGQSGYLVLSFTLRTRGHASVEEGHRLGDKYDHRPAGGGRIDVPILRPSVSSCDDVTERFP